MIIYLKSRRAKTVKTTFLKEAQGYTFLVRYGHGTSVCPGSDPQLIQNLYVVSIYI